jgi:hypothetical protein
LKREGYETISAGACALESDKRSGFNEILESTDIRALGSVDSTAELAALIFRARHSSPSDAVHLFSLVPKSLVSCLVNERVLEQLSSLHETVLSEFYATFRRLGPSNSEIEALRKWTEDSSLINEASLWVLTDKSLEGIACSSRKQNLISTALKELNNRAVTLSMDSILLILHQFGSTGELRSEVGQMIKHGPKGLETSIAELLDYPGLFADAVRTSKTFPESLIEHVRGMADDEGFLDVLSAVYRNTSYRDSDLTGRAVNMAIKKNSQSALELLAVLAADNLLNQSLLGTVLELVSNARGSETISPEFVDLGASLYNSLGPRPELRTWFQRCVVWLTKSCSEESVLPTKVTSFALLLGKFLRPSSNMVQLHLFPETNRQQKQS